MIALCRGCKERHDPLLTCGRAAAIAKAQQVPALLAKPRNVTRPVTKRVTKRVTQADHVTTSVTSAPVPGIALPPDLLAIARDAAGDQPLADWIDAAIRTAAKRPASAAERKRKQRAKQAP